MWVWRKVGSVIGLEAVFATFLSVEEMEVR